MIPLPRWTEMERIGIIFDCDGVLLDSMAVWHQLDDRLAKRARASFSQEDLDRITASTIPECARYIHEKFGLGSSSQDVVAIIEEEMYDFYTHDVTPKPGALTFVQATHDAQIPMAVASSTPPRLLKAGLSYTGFAPFLEAIVSVEDVGKAKRDPAVYDRARQSLGTSREQTWVFEDALYAIRTLNEAGYRSFALYDSDIAGTAAQLQAEAQAFAFSLEGLSPLQLGHRP